MQKRPKLAMVGGGCGRNGSSLGPWFPLSHVSPQSPLNGFFPPNSPEACFSPHPHPEKFSHSFPARFHTPSHEAQPCRVRGCGSWVFQPWFPSLPRRLTQGGGGGPQLRHFSWQPFLPPPACLPPGAREPRLPLLSPQLTLLPPPQPPFSKPSPLGTNLAFG